MTRSLSLVFLLFSIIKADIQPPESCPPGTIYRSQLYACLPCLPGKYCPGGTPATSATTSFDCPAGFYSLEGASSCTPCNPGTYENVHNLLLYPVCFDCPPGTYQPYFNKSAAYSTLACIPCPDGTYSDQPGSASCDGNIPYGIMHKISLNVYAPKTIGDISPLGFGNANMSCFAGWHCGYGSDRYKCPPGSYSKIGDSECTLCPPGSLSLTEGSASCITAVPCSGTGSQYIDKVGANSTNDCQTCPNGKKVLNYVTGNIYGEQRPLLTSNYCQIDCKGSGPGFVDNGTSCVACAVNEAAIYPWYNPNALMGVPVADNDIYMWNGTCSSYCPAGTYLRSSQGYFWCDVCNGANFFCPGGPVDRAAYTPAKQTCPNTLRTLFGAKSVADCYTPCSPGDCIHDGSTVCEARKPGYTYDTSFDKRTCSICPTGTGTTLTPGTAACSPAPAGSGWITNSTYGPCPAGHYCPISDVQLYGPTIIADYVPPIPCGPDEVPYQGIRCIKNTCPNATTYDIHYGTCSKFNFADDSNTCFSKTINSYVRSCPGVNVTKFVNSYGSMAFGCFGGTSIPSPDGSSCIDEQCAPGYYQDNDYNPFRTNVINGTRCRPCPEYDHLYCVGGITKPQFCHMNFTQSYGGFQGVVTPNRTTCTCPPGAIPKPNYNKCYTPITHCAVGEYVDFQNNVCIPCGGPYYCPDTINRYSCPSGQTSSTNKTTCVPGGNNQNSGCTGMPPTCSPGQSLICNGNTWQCTTVVCTGDESACNGRVTCTANNAPFTCTAFPSCVPGEYIEYYTPTVDTVCHTPPSGSTTCAAGTYLTVSGSSAATAIFACSPCPSGYTCSGGIGALALSVTEASAPFTSNPCTSPDKAIFTEIQPGTYPLTPLKVKCAKSYTIPAGMTTAVLSCPSGTVKVGGLLGCQPCPVGSANCQGEFHALTRTSNNNNNNNVPAASASPTPSNTPSPSSSASSAPPPQQDVLIPYLISSPDVCASAAVADKFLDPSTGIAINLRYSMATSLGYNGSAAFVSGLVLCDNTYIPVDKNAAINKANADQLFNSTNNNNNNNNRRRRLYDMLNSLSLPIDGTTVVVELGVSVPSILAPALTNLMVAMMTNQSTADIQALAANLTAIMASPEYVAMYPAQSGPNTATGLPPSLTAVINTAANAGNVPSFTASLGTVINAAIIPLFDALNITLSNFTASLFSSGVRSGQIITYTNNNNGNNGGATAPSESSGNSSNNSALGALVLIPIAGLVVWFIIWYRRRKEEKDKSAGKSLDDNFTDVTTSNTSTDKKFEVANPSTNLMIRRTVVEVKSNANSSTSAV